MSLRRRARARREWDADPRADTGDAGASLSPPPPARGIGCPARVCVLTVVWYVLARDAAGDAAAAPAPDAERRRDAGDDEGHDAGPGRGPVRHGRDATYVSFRHFHYRTFFRSFKLTLFGF